LRAQASAQYEKERRTAFSGANQYVAGGKCAHRAVLQQHRRFVAVGALE